MRGAHLAASLRIEYIRDVPSTTIHVPPDLLREVDVAARRQGISRNKFVLAACRDALKRDQGVWPEGFFEMELTPDDAALLQDASREMEEAIHAKRRSRGAPLL